MDKKTYNKQLSFIFGDMATIYRFIGGENRFRASAYQKASTMMDGLPQDVTDHITNNTLDDIPGIGESIAQKINEYVATGKIKKYEELKKQVPYGILELMQISGFGPQSLQRINKELKINTKDEFIKALQNGSIAKLKGFGQKKVENMLRGLKLHKTIEDRILLWNALEAGEKVISWLSRLPEVKQVELAGSLRRKKETIGDIDVLVACEAKHRNKIVNHFTSAALAKQVLVKGNTKVSVILNEPGRQADLRIVSEDEWGSALQYFTGSKEHNIHLRTIAREKGFKISEYGIFRIKDNKKIAGTREEEIYRTLGFQMIPAEMREDKGEIELAMKNKIPGLVTLNNIRGDLQMHSTYSDGINTIEEIARYIKKNFPYEYIVITDHSKSSRIAKGMDEKRALKQIKEIEAVNKKLGEDFIKKGIEVDILPDGSLDISDEVLSQLDWVTASIHSNFNQDNTDRIIKACKSRFVNCIGHPTGRLIGSREGYKIDMDKVIEVAKATHTALEINAQPQRMDMNDEFAMKAREKGVKIVISTDSHNLKQYDFMKLGVFIARRAWCTPGDILNTKSWKEVQLFCYAKKESKQVLYFI
jgi:DNA polymerase (family 10)